jgi:serpin B
MKRLALTFLVLVCSSRHQEVLAMEQSDPTTTLVKGNSAFALELYARLGRTDGNRFLSPFSISSALAMTYAGAEGDTAREIAKALHFNLPPDQFHAAFHRLIAEMHALTAAPAGQKEPDLQLFTANALWTQVGLAILDDFRKRIEVNYKGGLYPVDFRNATEEARRTINSWVEEQTKGKIKDLLKPAHLSSQTSLVLTNAIYFKSLWESPFRKENTGREPFHSSASDDVAVDMMNQSGRFRYFDGGTFGALELPYKGRASAMVILLPKAPDGLAQLESSLRTENLDQWLGNLLPHQVQVSLPRFRVIGEIELKDALSELGMPVAFDLRRADFSGMTGTRDLVISAVVHKAFVEVEEKGTEAAAATGVAMKTRAALAPVPPVIFRADHPFFFLIRDTRSGSILFLGRLVKP